MVNFTRPMPSFRGQLALFFTVMVAGSLTARDSTNVVDPIVQAYLDDKPHVAVVVGVVTPKDHQIFTFGRVKIDDQAQPPTGKTIFEIGSITKVFTGILLAEAVREKWVRLDDPVRQHLPQEWVIPRRDRRDITLLHLATHTSSLPVQPPGIGLFALVAGDTENPYGKYQPRHLIKMLKRIKLPRAIGARHEYSNLGVGLLGHALTQAGKEPSFEQLLISQVCDPLKMPDTRFTLSETQAKRFAQPHNVEGKATAPWTFGCLEACGGLRSTANDLTRFLQAHLGMIDTELTPSLEMATQLWRETAIPGQSVGLCWMRESTDEGKLQSIWHNGGTYGSRGFIGFDPARKVGVVVLCNCGHSVDEVALEILRHLQTTTK